jgi:hypothetical protein
LDLDAEIKLSPGEIPLRKGPDPIALIFGFLGVFGAVGVMLSLPAISQADASPRTSPYEHEPFEYIEARLLKWG